MNSRILSVATAALCAATAMAQLTIDSTYYTIDTLRNRMEGPGTLCTIVRLPQWPLNVYLLDVDMANPYNAVETVVAHDSLGTTETLAHMALRQTDALRRPVAACNASFWCVAGNGAPANLYALGSPWGGVVRNDTTFINSNLDADAWNGGPAHTAVAIVDKEKHIHIGHYQWFGVYSTESGGADFYHNINRRCLADNIALWTPPYGINRPFENDWTDTNTRGNNHSDNYYLTLNEDSRWEVNGQQTFTVRHIVRDADRQTLGHYDACMTAAGNARSKLAHLNVGDQVTANSVWLTLDNNNNMVLPTVRQLVEGNAAVLTDGQLTVFNTIEAYNANPYARTIYGTNAEGSHLYMAVVDRSTYGRYGESTGCSTAQLVQIMHYFFPKMTNAANFDGGGSAQMYAGGQTVNAPSDRRPRSVATAWMVFAIGERNDSITAITFADYRLRLQAGDTISPQLWGYNAHGEVATTHLDGYTLSAPAYLGSVNDSTFIAARTAANGILTATYRNLTATIPVTIEGNPLLRGDVDGNGSVDVSDINLLINIVLGSISTDKIAEMCNLVGSDGIIDISDINALISIILEADKP